MPGVSKSDIIALFQSEVMAYLPSRNSAPWYYGAVGGTGRPEIQNSPTLGDRNEEVLTSVGQIPGPMMSTTIFNMLHNFAMKLTRVRQARWAFVKTDPVGTWTYETTDMSMSSTTLTALSPNLALHFDLPIPQPLPGAAVIDDSDLRAFLAQLRAAVLNRRNNAYYAHTIISCHISELPPPPPPPPPAPPCHGSRGRR